MKHYDIGDYMIPEEIAFIYGDVDPDNPDTEPGYCPDCSGSGEGQHEGTVCPTCRGGGTA